ncbi:hypothetical protein F511_21089 [Dorcoceras hygrometricum]|uniref:Uncharacterized protein n=1 Tax=Dorcoceras hygrometricum TaxID=472368 RepID=A0A2Z7AD11_9LAMI|nr:hypothetical protein F511_21089 [Dorcoceras hygrometricum]
MPPRRGRGRTTRRTEEESRAGSDDDVHQVEVVTRQIGGMELVLARFQRTNPLTFSAAEGGAMAEACEFTVLVACRMDSAEEGIRLHSVVEFWGPAVTVDSQDIRVCPLVEGRDDVSVTCCYLLAVVALEGATSRWFEEPVTRYLLTDRMTYAVRRRFDKLKRCVLSVASGTSRERIVVRNAMRLGDQLLAAMLTSPLRRRLD